MTTYTSDQITAMSNAIDQAKTATNPNDVMSALNDYYAAQTSVRGYAQLAQQVINNTGSGAVANQEVANAVGQGTYTPQFQANLALSLANADFIRIQGNGFQVPTLADVATDHQTVFESPAFNIPITAWGGTAFSALGGDFTRGLATPAELTSVTPASFENMSGLDVNTAISDLFLAGAANIGAGHIDVGLDIGGAGTVLNLYNAWQLKFGSSLAGIFSLSQNQDGSYQVAELQTNTATDGTYANYSSTGQSNYNVSVSNPTNTPGVTDVSVGVGGMQAASYSLAEATAPIVYVDANGGVVSAGSANAILIGNAGATLTGGSGQNLLIDLGSGGTVFGGSGSNQIVVGGTSDIVNATSANITGLTAAIFSVAGTNDAVTLSGSLDVVSLLGSGTAFADGTLDTIYADGTSDTVALNSTSDTAFLNGSSDTAYADGTSDAVNGTGNNDSIVLNGSSDIGYDSGTLGAIYAYGSADTAALYTTSAAAFLNGTLDTGYANGNAEAINATGSNDAIVLNGSADIGYDNGTLGSIYAYGTADTAMLDTTSDAAFLNGTVDTVLLNGTSDVASLSTSDIGYGNGALDMISVNGTDGTGTGVSGITETVTDNPDGSWVDQLQNTGTQVNWSEEQFVHAANNQAEEQTTNYDDGTHTVQYWDVNDNTNWSTTIKQYNSNGQLTTDTVDNLDGSSLVTY